MKRKYELVYVVSPDATDDQVTELHTQVEGIVQRMGGNITVESEPDKGTTFHVRLPL